MPAGQRDRLLGQHLGCGRRRERRPEHQHCAPEHPSTRAPEHSCRKYNARVWIVLAAALVAARTCPPSAARGGRHRPPDQVVPLPPARRCRSTSRSAPCGSKAGTSPTSKSSSSAARRTPAQLARLPLAIDDTPARVSVRALQTDNTTDPALRADVTVRVPATRRDRARAGARRPHRDRRLQRPAHGRHPPRPDRGQGRVRHAAARGRHRLGHCSPTRGCRRTDCCACARSTATCGCRWPSARPTRASWRSR